MTTKNMVERMADEIAENQELTSMMFDVNLSNVSLRITCLEQWVMSLGYKPNPEQMKIVKLLNNQLTNIINTEITPQAIGLK